MRERLAAAFGALALAVILLAGGLRLVALQDLLREETYAHLDEHAHLVAAVLDLRVEGGVEVSPRVLERVLDDEARLRFVPADGGREIVVTGADYAGDGDDVRATEESLAGTLTVDGESAAPGRLLPRRPVVGAHAGCAGRAAGRAGGLVDGGPALGALHQARRCGCGAGTGSVRPRPSRTRIPEAQAIAQALRASAAHLEARVSHERDFAEHASHVLRTPLTGLLLELEDLTLRDDVPADVKDAARRCMVRVEAVNASAGDLVAMTRSAALMEGAETTLEDLARHVAQEWSDELAGRRTVSAAVEGDLSLRLTPGPMEQVLDLVLADVKRGNGPARLVFVGEGGHVRVRLSPGTVPGTTPRDGVEAAAALAGAQGGRVLGADDGEVEVLLPRR